MKKVKYLGVKDGILCYEIDGKIYCGGAMMWMFLAIKNYDPNFFT